MLHRLYFTTTDASCQQLRVFSLHIVCHNETGSLAERSPRSVRRSSFPPLPAPYSFLLSHNPVFLRISHELSFFSSDCAITPSKRGEPALFKLLSYSHSLGSTPDLTRAFHKRAITRVHALQCTPSFSCAGSRGTDVTASTTSAGD